MPEAAALSIRYARWIALLFGILCLGLGVNELVGGITLGPAMTFGFIAAHHAAGLDPEKLQAKSASSP